jgi:translation initiation factor 1
MEKPRGSLGDLLARQGVQVSDAPAEPTSPLPTPPKPGGIDLAACSKIVVRRERKGRGGKTATIVAGLQLREKQLDQLAKDLRRALGCGASVDGDTIVVQGDLTTRTAQWLQDHGAKRVVIGN